MIALVDGNNFYVSCERIFQPELRHQPVAVLSNNDGCVISRSNEFKALQIPMGTPYFQLKDQIDQFHLIFKSSNYELYGDISRRIIAVLHEFSPDVEPYSIDEAFVHLNPAAATDYFRLGRQIRQTILQWIGIPCGVGFATSKTLAKIANHIGKKLPSGVFVMPQEPREVLQRTPVGEVWGVGGRLAPRLQKIGIHTAWQLAQSDPSNLRRKFSVTLAETILELRGESVIKHENPIEPSQSISTSRSFGFPVVEFEHLRAAVASYIADAARKLRKEQQVAAGANVYFVYYPEYTPHYRAGGMSSFTINLTHPTNATGTIQQEIGAQLRKIFIPGRRYNKAGVVFFGLESEKASQMELFCDHAQVERDRQLSQALDKINQKFGRHTLFSLSEGIAQPWQMRRNMLSPDYTTNWNAIPEVK